MLHFDGITILPSDKVKFYRTSLNRSSHAAIEMVPRRKVGLPLCMPWVVMVMKEKKIGDSKPGVHHLNGSISQM
jgi:hypothetical protein